MVDTSVTLVGSIDQGTSSSRFLVFNTKDGSVVSNHQIECISSFPNDEQIRSVGITNQRETTIVWDKKTGKPFYPAIVWLDSRTADLVEQYSRKTPNKSKVRGHLDYFLPTTGLPLNPYFSAFKLRWIIDNVPEVKPAIAQGKVLAGTVDSWLIWKLTGGPNAGQFVTDVTNASRTLLMNIKTCSWDNEMCQFFDIDKSLLAKIKSSAEVYGQIRNSGTPCDGKSLAGCLGDQQAALLGQGCLSEGMAKNTYGTGCFLLYNTGQNLVISEHGLLSTVGFQLGPKAKVVYALEGAISVAGATVRWLRDSLKIIEKSSDIEGLAKTQPDSGGLYFVPAFSGLYAPHWDPSARGTMCGISFKTDRGHLARAALEAVCFQTREILDSMEKDSKVPVAALKVDGGMTVNNLFMEMQADLLAGGTKVIRLEDTEATARGAAVAAGLAVGVWDLDKFVQTKLAAKEFRSKITDQERAERYGKWQEAVKRSKHWATTSSSSTHAGASEKGTT